MENLSKIELFFQKRRKKYPSLLRDSSALSSERRVQRYGGFYYPPNILATFFRKTRKKMKNAPFRWGKGAISGKKEGRIATYLTSTFCPLMIAIPLRGSVCRHPPRS
jgi:hypothetical protein